MNKSKIYPKYMLLLPLVFYVVFFLVPSTFGYGLAFTDWSATNSKFSGLSFVGIQNLLDALKNRAIPVALVNTLIYASVKTVFVTVLGLFFAYMLNRKIAGQKVLRTVFFLPSVFAALVVGLIFSGIFKTRGGTVNEILAVFKIHRVQWLGNRWLSILAINVASIWSNVGYATIISLAGMQSVSKDYIEAAKIDGATKWQTLWRVTIPNVMPSITICTFLTLTNSFKLFDQNLALTAGRPFIMQAGGLTVKTTEMLALNIVNSFYSTNVNSRGVGQAKAVLFFILVAAIGLVQLKSTRSKEVQQ